MPRKKRKRKSPPEQTGLWISPDLSRLLHGGPRDEFDTSRVLQFADVALGVRPQAAPPAPPATPAPPAAEPPPPQPAPGLPILLRPSEAPNAAPPRRPKLALREPIIAKPRRLQVPKRPSLHAPKPRPRPPQPKPARMNYPKPPGKPKD